MRATPQCAQCGTPLSNDAPEGFCPRCMLEGALHLRSPSGIGQPVSGIESPASTLGDYQLLEEVARGGMGVVYRARQISLNRIVAVKLILIGQFADKYGIRRFQAEAAAAAKLRHPNIIAIYEIGEQSGQHYFSMEYVEGQNLAAFIREHPISIRQAAHLVKKIADAIHYAHQQGIIHRDLKPSNILIDSLLEPRITDFGLARDLQKDSDLTLTGQVLGSPNYISPEQARGQSAGAPSDIYSLGAILYHLLTARPPFAAETLTDTLKQAAEHDPVGPRLLNPSIPRDLETICLKCLEKDPAQRYQSAAAVSEELTRFLDDEPIHARPLSPPAKAWRWCRRKPALPALAAALTLSLLLGFAGVFWQWQRSENNLYFSTMRLVQDELDRKSIGRARELLGKFLPRWWNRDLRGWEWYYYWNQCRGDELLSINAFPGLPVLSVAISDNGELLAIGGSGPLTLWDTIKSVQLVQLRQSNYANIASLAFSTDQNHLFTGTSDGRVLGWNLQTRVPDMVLSNLTSVRSLKVSPNGKFLAVYAHAGLTLWDLSNYARLAKFAHTSGTDNLPGGIAFSPDSSILAFSREGGEIVLWDTLKRSDITEFLGHEHNVTALAFSLDGLRLVSGSRDRTVRVWETSSGRAIRTLPEFTSFITGLCFSPDGKLLSVVGAGQPVLLFETRFWQEINVLKGHEGIVSAVTFTPDGSKMVTGAHDGTVKFWPALRNPNSFSERLPADLLGSELLQAGTGIYLRYADGSHGVWSVDPLKELVQKRFPAQQRTSSNLSPDGNLWAAAMTNEVRVYDYGTQGLLTIIPSPLPRPRSLAFSFDGQLLACEGVGDSCQIWRTQPQANGTAPLTSFPLNRSNVGTLKFSPDGRFLAVLSESGTKVEVWTVGTRSKVAFTTNHAQSDIAISRDGYTAVTACGGTGKLRVWDLRNGSPIAALGGQLGTLWSVAFSPDQTGIFACGGDGTVRIWDRKTLEEVAILRLHKERLEQLAVSPTGETLYVLGPDAFGGWRLFTLRAPKLLDL